MSYSASNVLVQTDLAWLVFLVTKPRPRLVGAVCSSRRWVAEAGGMEGYRPSGESGEMMRCGRPVWGDGKGITTGSGPIGEGLCSRCLHEYAAFHAPYTTLQANPAASALSGTSILRRADIFGRRGDVPLPEVGGQTPDVFPDDWNIHA
jgi:hypothetical protein